MAKITLKNVRLSFPSIFKRETFQGEEGKFAATFLINKETHADVIEEIENAIKEKIKTDLKGAKLPADKICLKDGEDIEYAGYKGHYSIKASNNKRPLVIDRDKTPLTEDDNKLYAGCYVNAIIELWTQSNSWGKRINANLLGVQFYADGEPFSDGVNASSDDFDAFGDDEDDTF